MLKTETARRYSNGLILALAATVVAALLRYLLDPLVGDSSQYMLFYFSVMLAATVGGLQSGVMATVLGAVAGTWLFAHLGHVGESLIDDATRLAMYVLFGGATMLLAARLHWARDQAAGQARNWAAANESLRQSEERYRLAAEELQAVMDAAPGGIMVAHDPLCHVITGNRPAHEVFGVPSGKNISATPAEDAPSAYFRIYRNGGEMPGPQLPMQVAATTGNVVREEELQVLRADGTERTIIVTAAPLYSSSGGIRGAVGAIADITDRKRVEEAMRRSEERLQATFDNAGVGIVEVEGDDRFVAVNNRACEILGRSRDELLKTNVHDITWPDDRALSDRVNGELHAGRTGTVGYEKRYCRGDGTPVWVHVTISPISDAGGRWVRSITTIEDISDRKKTEEALRESEVFFRQMLESIPGMVFTTRPDGYCDFQSQQWVEYTGVPMNEHLGTGWNRLLHPDDRRRAYDAWRAAVEERAGYDLEYRVRRHDGIYQWFKVIGRPIRDSAGQIARWFGVALNIEDLKLAEANLRVAKDSAENAKAAAEQANRAKDHFLAVLSHELRTPLTPVVMGLSMLQDRPDLDAEVYGTLEMVRRNVEMEARLIDDLLDVTRIARGKVELGRTAVELGTIIERAADVCRADIEARKLHFAIDLGKDGPYWLNADAPRLQQVFWNLLKNAIKFTPHGGCVGIRCRSAEGHAIVEVSDSGIGIEAEALDRVFNAFEQAERSITRQFGGLGLGLAISKALVEMHGGTIEARSAGCNLGATFLVRLPLAEVAGEAATAEDARTVRRPMPHPLRVLLVEDHGVTAQMMAAVLSADGHTVEMAGDMATALLLASRQPFDLLLSDLGLPDGSGHDLLRELRRRGHRFPGVALSGYGQQEDVERSRQAGFSAHLTKPASRDAVIDAIASATSQPAAGWHAMPSRIVPSLCLPDS